MNDQVTRAGFEKDQLNSILAALVFFFTLSVFTITLTPTVPFWDGGEYIATAHILGIPHAPGTPLFVLIAKVVSLIPAGDVAQMVNWMSALASALTLLFTYLITVKIARLIFDPSLPNNRMLSYLAGLVAALMAGFATTFWDNAIEAEVYAGACALMTFAVWTIMRWYERLDMGNEDGHLLVVTYIVGLGVSIHLGVAIAAWAAVLFVFAVRPSYLKRWDYLGWAIATMSLGVGVNTMTFLWAPLVLVLTLLIYLVSGRLNKLALWSSVLFVLGLSVHFFLLIRSNQDPIINEAAPKDWESLWLMLTRDQYKPPSPLLRRTDLWFQIDHMWLRYLEWNFTLFEVAGRKFFQLPVLLAITGAVVHFARHKRTWVILATLFMFLGPAMVFYLNFSGSEVRERDYFFVQNFQFLAIWVGLGAAWLVEQCGALSKVPGTRKTLMGVGAVLMLVMAILPLKHNWESHDRRGFYLANDFAYNLVNSMEQNAIIFTNGDNDTFSLWYLQEVEGIRKDVRVVNLSLLNTPWYIKQLRDLEPKVPINLTDAQIDGLRPVYDRKGNLIRVRDIITKHILQRTDKKKRPLYTAVTVPDDLGQGKNRVMEGLVWRILEEKTNRTIDMAASERLMYDVYRFRGVLQEDLRDGKHNWIPDDSVYKPSGPSDMVRTNYAIILMQIAMEHERGKRMNEALDAIDRAIAVDTKGSHALLTKGTFLTRQRRFEEAAEVYRLATETRPGDWRPPAMLGSALQELGRTQEAVDALEEAVGRGPGVLDPYHRLFLVHYERNNFEQALEVLGKILVISPNDQRFKPLYDTMVRTGRFPFNEEGDSSQGQP